MPIYTYFLYLYLNTKGLYLTWVVTSSWRICKSLKKKQTIIYLIYFWFTHSATFTQKQLKKSLLFISNFVYLLQIAYPTSPLRFRKIDKLPFFLCYFSKATFWIYNLYKTLKKTFSTPKKTFWRLKIVWEFLLWRGVFLKKFSSPFVFFLAFKKFFQLFYYEKKNLLRTKKDSARRYY